MSNHEAYPELKERLSAYAHESWSGWMRYLFDHGSWINGRFLISREKCERWKRQVNTSYADLPETEKESDRKEAIKIMDIALEEAYLG